MLTGLVINLLHTWFSLHGPVVTLLVSLLELKTCTHRLFITFDKSIGHSLWFLDRVKVADCKCVCVCNREIWILRLRDMWLKDLGQCVSSSWLKGQFDLLTLRVNERRMLMACLADQLNDLPLTPSVPSRTLSAGLHERFPTRSLNSWWTDFFHHNFSEMCRRFYWSLLTQGMSSSSHTVP